MSLCEPEVPVEAVQQYFECVLQRLKVMLLRGISLGTHFCLRFQSERAQISEQMAKDLQLVGSGKAIKLQHDRRIK